MIPAASRTGERSSSPETFQGAGGAAVCRSGSARCLNPSRDYHNAGGMPS
ncbi:hypothetical protein [Rubrobacter naiadicus]|nr:hypothetical protein [Rubrobacter naiadicus]